MARKHGKIPYRNLRVSAKGCLTKGGRQKAHCPIFFQQWLIWNPPSVPERLQNSILKIYERNSKSAASSSLFPITQPSIGKPIQMQPM